MPDSYAWFSLSWLFQFCCPQIVSTIPLAITPNCRSHRIIVLYVDAHFLGEESKQCSDNLFAVLCIMWELIQALKDNLALVRLDLAQSVGNRNTFYSRTGTRLRFQFSSEGRFCWICSTAACAVFSPVRLRHFLKNTLYTEVWFGWVVDSSACIFSKIAQD